jgi:Phage derived protein Gp49-like (DUF891)
MSVKPSPEVPAHLAKLSRARVASYDAPAIRPTIRSSDGRRSEVKLTGQPLIPWLAGRTRKVVRTQAYSINAMPWGTVELEPEVRDWLEQLPTDHFARAAFYIDLLADEGPLLSEPYTRQLDRKLREFGPAGGADHVLDRFRPPDRVIDRIHQDADAPRQGDRACAAGTGPMYCGGARGA